MIYTVTLNPAIDKTVTIPDFCLDSVNRVVDCRLDPGGKGINVSKVLSALGQPSVVFRCWPAIRGALCARCSRRPACRWLRMNCRPDTAESQGGRPGQAFKHRYQRTRRPGKRGGARRPAAGPAGPRAAGDLVVLAGSLPAGAPPDTYAGWVSACQAAGAKVFVDADGPALREAVAARPYLIKPNESELVRLAAARCQPRQRWSPPAGAACCRRAQGGYITRGARGALSVRRRNLCRRRAVCAGGQYRRRGRQYGCRTGSGRSARTSPGGKPPACPRPPGPPT